MKSQELKQLLWRIIRQRQVLIKKGCSKINQMQAYKSIENLCAWLNAYGNTANETTLIKWAKNKKESFFLLIPGNASGESTIQKFNELTSN